MDENIADNSCAVEVNSVGGIDSQFPDTDSARANAHSGVSTSGNFNGGPHEVPVVNIAGEDYDFPYDKSLANDDSASCLLDFYCHHLLVDDPVQNKRSAPARKTSKGGTVKSEKKFHLPDNYKKHDPEKLLEEMMRILSGQMKTDMIEYLVKTERVVPFIDNKKVGAKNTISDSEFKELIKDVDIDDHKRVKKILDKLKLSDKDVYDCIKDIQEEETPKMINMNCREFTYEACDANDNLQYVDITTSIPEHVVNMNVEGFDQVAKAHFNQDRGRTDIVRIPLIIQMFDIACCDMVCTDTGANISLEGLDRYLARGGKKCDIKPAKIMLINATESSDQRILGFVEMKFFTIHRGALISVLSEKVFIVDGPLQELLLGTPAIKRMELVIRGATELQFSGKVVDCLPDSDALLGSSVAISAKSNTWPDRKMKAIQVSRHRFASGVLGFKIKYETTIMGPESQPLRCDKEGLIFYENEFKTPQNVKLKRDKLRATDLITSVKLISLNTGMSPYKKLGFDFTNENPGGYNHRMDQKKKGTSYGTLTRGPYDPKRKPTVCGHEEIMDDIVTVGPVAISVDERLKFCPDADKNDNLKHLKPEIRKKIEKIHSTYPTAFASETRVVGKFSGRKFSIQTMNNDGPQIKQFPLPKDKLDILKKEIEKLEKHGVFEKSEKRSKYNSPVFVVGKHKGKDSIADKAENTKRNFEKYRVIFDARSINSMTIGGGNCMLPTMDHVLSSIESKHVIIADLKNAFWALEYDDASKDKLAVMVDNASYRHGRVMMGGKESMVFLMEALGETFNKEDFEKFKQRPENHELKDTELHECLIAYVDDILLFHESETAVLLVYAFMLEQCVKFGWLVEKEKVSVLEDSFELLGSSFERLPNGDLGYFIKKDKSSNMMNFPVPNTKRSLASRMSTISYYDRFLPGHKVITAVLFAFLKDDDNTFTHLMHRVWAMLMLLIRLDLCLAVPHKNKPIVLLLDSSLTSCSSYLCQLYRGEDGKLHIRLIKATSKVFGKSMMKMSSIHKEMYNFVGALKSGEDILRANNSGIVAITDCLPLIFTLRSQHTTNQFTVAGSWISSFPDMQYLHVNGSVLRSVDIHSRLFTNSYSVKRRFDKDMATTIPTDLFTANKLYPLEVLQKISDDLPSPEYTQLSKIKAEPLKLSHLNHLVMEDTPAETEYFRGVVDGYEAINPAHSVWRPYVKTASRSCITKVEFENEMKKDMAKRLKTALTNAVIDLTKPESKIFFNYSANSALVIGVDCLSRNGFKVLEHHFSEGKCFVELHGDSSFFLNNGLTIDIVGSLQKSKITILPHNSIKYGHVWNNQVDTIGLFSRLGRPEKVEMRIEIPVDAGKGHLEWDLDRKKTTLLAEKILDPENLLERHCRGFSDLFLEEVKRPPPTNPISRVNDFSAIFEQKSGVGNKRKENSSSSKKKSHFKVFLGSDDYQKDFRSIDEVLSFVSSVDHIPQTFSEHLNISTLDESRENTTQEIRDLDEYSPDREFQSQQRDVLSRESGEDDQTDAEDMDNEVIVIPDDEIFEVQAQTEEEEIEKGAEKADTEIDKQKLVELIGSKTRKELENSIRRKSKDIREDPEVQRDAEKEIRELTQKAISIIGGVNSMIYTISGLMSKRNVDFKKMFREIQEGDRDIRKLRNNPDRKKEYLVCEDIVWRKYKIGDRLYPAIVVPDWFVRMLALALHRNNFHLGGRKGFHLLNRSFYNPNLLKITLAAEKGCLGCHFGRYPVRREFKGEQTVRPRVPGQDLSLDYLQSAPETKRGFSNILIVCDKLSGFVLLLPQKKLTGAETLSNILIILSIFGNAKVFEMDGATCFNEAKRYLTLIGKTVKTRGPSSKSQGTSERAILEVRTLLNSTITGLTRDNRDNWDLILPQVQQTLNSTIIYPKKNVYSRNELFFNVLNVNAARNPFLLNDIFKSLCDIRAEKDSRLIKASNVHQFPPLKAGNLVYIRRKKLEIPPSEEDHKRFLQPSVKELYLVQKTSPGFVRLKSLVSNEERTVHRDRVTLLDTNSLLNTLPLSDTLENLHTSSRYKKGSLDVLKYLEAKDPHFEKFLMASQRDIRKEMEKIIQTEVVLEEDADILEDEEPEWDDFLIETGKEEAKLQSPDLNDIDLEDPPISSGDLSILEDNPRLETNQKQDDVGVPAAEDSSEEDPLLTGEASIMTPTDTDEILDLTDSSSTPTIVDVADLKKAGKTQQRRRKFDLQFPSDESTPARRTRGQLKTAEKSSDQEGKRPKLKVSYQDPIDEFQDISNITKKSFLSQDGKKLEFSDSDYLLIPSEDNRIQEIGDVYKPLELRREAADQDEHSKALQEVCRSEEVKSRQLEEKKIMKDVGIKSNLQPLDDFKSNQEMLETGVDKKSEDDLPVDNSKTAREPQTKKRRPRGKKKKSS